MGATVLRKYGVSEIVKNASGVKECDAFYWEHPEYANRS